MHVKPQFYLSFLFLVFAMPIMAKSTTDSIKVNGVCSSCKSRIEAAAYENEGVFSAVWSSEHNILKISYDDQKISSKQIQTSIAMKGHDTELFRANDKKYEQLPDCCHYKRIPMETVNVHGNHEFTSEQKSNNKDCCSAN